MALTTEQIDILADGGEVDFNLPDDPGVVSPDGIFFQDVFFETADGDFASTQQGELSLDTVNFGINGFSASENVSFTVRNADVTGVDNFGITRSPNSIFSVSGPDASLTLSGTRDGNSGFRLLAEDGATTMGTAFISDGARVTVDATDPDRSASVQVGVNNGTFQSDGETVPEGQSVDGVMVIEGEGTRVDVISTGGGRFGSLEVGVVTRNFDGSDPITTNRSADGLAIIRDGAEVNVHSFVGVGTTREAEDATANGVLIVEGEGTTVTVGNDGGVTSDGFMRIGEGNGKGLFILRDGAEFNILKGTDFGGGLQLSGHSERPGGEADALITGAGTRLFVEQGSIQVGRNEGEARFVVSDGATVETLFFTSGRAGTGDTIIDGEGTQLILSGEQLTPEFGAFLTVGRDAQGTMTVQGGADVSIIGAGDDSTFPGFQVGRADGGVGVLTVTGAGSTISVDGSAITDGGSGETGFIRAGRDAGSDGTIDVLDGGVITNDPNGVFIVAQNEGSVGTVRIDGAGSLIDFGASATISSDAIGARGTGNVVISNGGLLRGGEVINHGIMDITSGGRLEADIRQEGLLLSSGGIETTVIDGDYTLTGGGGFGMELSTVGGLRHDTVSVTGDVSLDGIFYVGVRSVAEVQGLSLDVISGASITLGDTLSVRLVEFDDDTLASLDDPALGAAIENAVDLSASVIGDALVVDFGTATTETGSDAGETLTGGDVSDALNGLGGDDMINGGAGNDRMTGGSGNDSLDGGAGIDTAIFEGDQDNYTLTLSSTTTMVADRRADGQGTDTVSAVEFLDFGTENILFGDGPMSLDTFDDATGLTAEQFAEITELYIAYFNRAPDAIGLNFWASAFARGEVDLAGMAELFFDQAETRSVYASALNEDGSQITDVTGFVTDIFTNVLGRTPDQGGLDFWRMRVTHVQRSFSFMALL